MGDKDKVAKNEYETMLKVCTAVRLGIGRRKRRIFHQCSVALVTRTHWARAKSPVQNHPRRYGNRLHGVTWHLPGDLSLCCAAPGIWTEDGTAVDTMVEDGTAELPELYNFILPRGTDATAEPLCIAVSWKAIICFLISFPRHTITNSLEIKVESSPEPWREIFNFSHRNRRKYGVS